MLTACHGTSLRFLTHFWNTPFKQIQFPNPWVLLLQYKSSRRKSTRRYRNLNQKSHKASLPQWVRRKQFVKHFYKSGSQNITLVAVYCSPRFTITEAQFMDYFNTLGEHFIAAGDYNAKHTRWGSRLVAQKRKQL